jgi:hypothetical protein
MKSLRIWATVARLGTTAWFFGNLYETAVGVPQLLADAPARRLLGAGSPLRYWAPLGPLTLAATTTTLVGSWRSGGSKTAVVATAASTASAVAISAYLIRTVNIRLYGGSLTDADRRALIGRWHRLNGVRLGALVIASVALQRVAKPENT